MGVLLVGAVWYEMQDERNHTPFFATIPIRFDNYRLIPSGYSLIGLVDFRNQSPSLFCAAAFRSRVCATDSHGEETNE